MPTDVEPDDLSLDEHHRRADEAVDAALAATAERPYGISALEPVRKLLDSSPEDLRSIVIVLMDRATRAGSAPDAVRGVHPGMPGGWLAAQVLGAVGTRRPAFSRRDVAVLLDMASGRLHEGSEVEWVAISLVGQPVGAAERAVRSGGVGELEGPIRGLAKAPRHDPLVLGRPGGAVSGATRRAPRHRGFRCRPGLKSTHRSSRTAIPGVSAGGLDSPPLVPDQRRLFVQLPLASGVTPSAAWQRKVDALTHGEGCTVMVRAMLDDALTSTTTVPQSFFTYEGRTYVSSGPPVADANSVIVRGAIWAAAGSGEDWVPSLLTELGLHFGTSGRGDNETRDQRLANTSAAALGTLSGPAAIAGLGRLKARITNRNVGKQIAKALEAAAARSGISPSELLELAVPTLGIGPDGRREIPVGDHVAVLAIEDDDATLTWRAPDGRVTARPPAAIAGETAAIAKAKDEHKELRKALGVERGRVEDLFAERREWSVADWRSRYLTHPLTGTIGRRLIWAFPRQRRDRHGDARRGGRRAQRARRTAGRPGTGCDRRLVAPHRGGRDHHRRVADADPGGRGSPAVQAGIPGDLRDHPGRGDDGDLLEPLRRAHPAVPAGPRADDGPPLGIELPGPVRRRAERDRQTGVSSHGLRAEFWHDAIGADIRRRVQHCTTDQVRFVHVDLAEQPVPLRDVPPLVFSEAMRDVDLFVSVASVGADRNWQDGGRNRDAALDPYWNRVWDDDLSPTAGVRRDALERMIPGLVIADRLELGERWLEVRGDLRTYRIHLGSGNC